MNTNFVSLRLLMLLGSLIIMGLCGLGPSLIWTRGRDRIVLALLLSVPIGCTLIGLILGFLSLAADLSIRTSALPVTLMCLLLSAGICALDFRHRRADYSLSFNRNSCLVFVSILAAILIMLIIPMHAATYEHTLFQENAWDAFTYMALGGTMKYGTADAPNHPEQEAALLDEYPVARNIASFVVLHRKHSASMLAWMSTLFKLPIYLVYYPFNVICIVMTWLAALALTRLLNLPLYQQHAASALIAVGFWSFLLFDISATSHLHSLSSLLLVLYGWMQVEFNPDFLISRERIFFGFAIAGLYSIYPEIAIVATGVFGLYFLVRLYRQASLAALANSAAKHLISLGVAIIFLGPTLIPTLLYLKPAASEAANSPTIWATFIYPFLFADQNRILEALVGLWGGSLLHPISLGLSGSPVIGSVILVLHYLLAILLTSLGLIGVANFMQRTHKDHHFDILLTTAAVFWGGAFVIILGRDRYYTGGKLIGMGFAAVFLTIFLISHKLPDKVTSYKKVLTHALPILLIIWTAVNLGGTLHRFTSILSSERISNYQRLVTPELNSLVDIQQALRAHDITLLASDISNDPQQPAAMLDMMLSEDYDYLQIAGLGTFWGNRPQGWLQRNHLPDALVIEQGSGTNYVAEAGIGDELYADKQLALYALTPADFDALLIDVDVFASGRQPVKFGSSIWPITVEDQTLQLTGNDMQLFFLASGRIPVRIILEITSSGPGYLHVTLNQRQIGTIGLKPDLRVTEALCLIPDEGTNHIILTPAIEAAIPYGMVHRLMLTTSAPSDC